MKTAIGLRFFVSPNTCCPQDEPTTVLMSYSEEYCMVSCPKCGKALRKPDKALKNWLFHIESYTCGNCGTNFKITR
jgi:hypothetical protein